MRLMRLSGFFIVAMFLAACQTAPKSTNAVKLGGEQLEKNNRDQFTAKPFAETLAFRGTVNGWQLAGSFSYVDPNESGAGRLKWNFSGNLLDQLRLNDVINREEVVIVGPLGTGSIELTTADERARLVSGREQFEGNNVEELLLAVIGWRLPIDDVRYWLFGLPSPNVAGEFWLNEQGLLDTLHQSDWEIEFEQYEQYALNIKLPNKITAIHRGNQAKVKLVIKNIAIQHELAP